MAKAYKLPSGTWRVNLYLGKKDGKEIRRSITGRTRKEAEQNAALYMTENHLDDSPMTVGEAVDKYIRDVTPTVSPVTVNTYRLIQKYRIDDISAFMVDKVTEDDLQAWINELSVRYSPKTIQGAYALVVAVLHKARPSYRPSVKLPSERADLVQIPTKEEVQKLIEIANPRMRKAIMLAAFCSLRRGEVSFLRYKDIKDGCVSIHGDVVPGAEGGWVFKETAKTSKSNRTIRVPQFVLDEIGDGEPEERVVSVYPNVITNDFHSYCKKLGYPYHFHLLRHFFASELIAQGVPREYIQALGGWENGGALEKIYTHILTTSKNEYSQKVADYFSDSFSCTNRVRSVRK